MSCTVITLVALTGSAAALPHHLTVGGLSGENVNFSLRDLESDDLVARQTDTGSHYSGSHHLPTYQHGSVTPRG